MPRTILPSQLTDAATLALAPADFRAQLDDEQTAAIQERLSAELRVQSLDELRAAWTNAWNAGNVLLVSLRDSGDPLPADITELLAIVTTPPIQPDPVQLVDPIEVVKG